MPTTPTNAVLEISAWHSHTAYSTQPGELISDHRYKATNEVFREDLVGHRLQYDHVFLLGSLPWTLPCGCMLFLCTCTTNNNYYDCAYSWSDHTYRYMYMYCTFTASTMDLWPIHSTALTLFSQLRMCTTGILPCSHVCPL